MQAADDWAFCQFLDESCEVHRVSERSSTYDSSIKAKVARLSEHNRASAVSASLNMIPLDAGAEP